MATDTTTPKAAKEKLAAKKTATGGTVKKAPVKRAASAKPSTEKKAVKPETSVTPSLEVVETSPAVTFEKPTLAKGRYVFATGRRKTAIANVRLFAGSEDNVINKKKLEIYFGQSGMANKALHPLALTGLLGDFYFSANVNGGGSNAQSEAVRHGVAQALASMNDDMKNVLKKNGFLTRDDRKKERKKPGLRGARRAPQWAKR